MSTLLATRGLGMGVKHLIGDRTTIGRDPENRIQVSDPGVSRFHCEVVRRGQSFRIIDRESRNGVLVNGEYVHEKTLLRNDEITVGTSAFLFDPDEDLKNTVFSDKRVHFYSSTDETIVRLDFETPSRAASGESRLGEPLATQVLLGLGQMLAAPELPAAQALGQILQALLRAFGSSRGGLFKWDAVAEDFAPLVVESDREALHVPVHLVRSIIDQPQAILAPPGPSLPSLAMEEDGMKGEQAVLCVPLLRQEQVRGMIALEAPDENDLVLRDVQLLQAIGSITQGAIDLCEARGRLAGPAIDRFGADADRDYPIVGSGPAFEALTARIDEAGRHTHPVLLTGEAGVGKGAAALEIHRRSERREFPFLKLDCTALSEKALEVELFGNEANASPELPEMRQGLLERAHGGTLLLDQVADIGAAAQTRLLRFLQEGALARLGGQRRIAANVRVVAATDADLAEAAKIGAFRDDLARRLLENHIHLPPLRERSIDIDPLAQRFLEIFARTYHKNVTSLSDRALEALRAYDWPGNVRELRNALERAVLLCRDEQLQPAHFVLSSTSPSPDAP